MSLRWPLTLSCSLVLLATACKGDDGDDDVADEVGTETDSETGSEEHVFVDATFEVRESVEQLHITHAEPGVELRVVDSSGTELQRALTDDLGSLIFRQLPPGEGYSVEETSGSEREAARELAVMSVAGSQPDQSFYDNQVLEPGYNYITTRDGTTLSAYVFLPGPPEDGPYPTLVNYSGYEPSKPGSSLADQFDLGGIDLSSLCGLFPVVCDAPSDPSGILGGFLGFATVSVNMRGTGCSGGAYDFFETLQVLDGYDVIETVATQDWVLGNKVAMSGLSYPGISQLFVAKSQPPSLAAITPLSVIAHTSDSVMRPGGITNDGFAYNWGENVLDGAQPYGQGWEQDLVEAGDVICEENQLLHGQLVDVIEKAEANPYYTPEVYDPLIPERFAGEIEVPVFLTGAWQDEQTGGHFPVLWEALSNSPNVRFTMFNGIHADGYVPENLLHWGAFFDFYVSERIPMIPPDLRDVAPLLFGQLIGDQVEFGPDPYTGYASYEEAFAAYQAEDPIKVLFEFGASSAYDPGIPQSAWQLTFTDWPPPELQPQRWYLQPDGSFAPVARRTRARLELPHRSAGLAHDHAERRHQPTAAALDLAARRARHRRGLHQRALDRGHGHGRPGQRRSLHSQQRRRGRHRGQHQRGPARRAGDVRAERLATRERARARSDPDHRAAPGSDPRRGRRAAGPERRVGRGANRDLLVRPRI
ncbi:MAG: CocE/NonD family hydrolase [Deltaproteobacteria bacterium]|nr:CocE/NonD family hydrolase [Deltaproteobacteria bacterium]